MCCVCGKLVHAGFDGDVGWVDHYLTDRYIHFLCRERHSPNDRRKEGTSTRRLKVRRKEDRNNLPPDSVNILKIQLDCLGALGVEKWLINDALKMARERCEQMKTPKGFTGMIGITGMAENYIRDNGLNSKGDK